MSFANTVAALTIAVAAAPAPVESSDGASADAALYATMAADTLARGRALESVMWSMLPLSARVDECVLIAAPKDQDWEGEYLGHDGARWGLKVGFDDKGEIAFLIWRARAAPPPDPHAHDPPVELTMPIVVDRPLVAFAGGPGRLRNHHALDADQRHGVDLVGWRGGGSYATTAGERNEDFVIWDAPVLSPVDGVVVHVENGALDHARPQKEWADDKLPFGNAVMIEVRPRGDRGPPRFVVLAHMRQGTVAVAAGQRVKIGDAIGRVGNSGNSSEPHLHIHVQDGGALKQGNSAPFVVDGAPLLRGVLILPKAK